MPARSSCVGMRGFSRCWRSSRTPSPPAASAQRWQRPKFRKDGCRSYSAHADRRSKQLRLIARRLANAGRLPYRQIGDLLLVEDEDGEYAEAVRLRIARDYWRALDRADVGPVSPEA